MSQKQWVRLTGMDGEHGAWLNMAAVAAVRQDERGRLRIEMIGEAQRDPDKHPFVHRSADVEAILAYLERATFTATVFATPDEENLPDSPTPLVTIIGDTVTRFGGEKTATIDLATWRAMTESEQNAWAAATEELEERG